MRKREHTNESRRLLNKDNWLCLYFFCFLKQQNLVSSIKIEAYHFALLLLSKFELSPFQFYFINCIFQSIPSQSAGMDENENNQAKTVIGEIISPNVYNDLVKAVPWLP